MLPDIIVAITGPLVAALLVGIVGYLVFRTDQRNKNTAIDSKFKNIEKDIAKNDERIRQDFKEQNDRNEKEYQKMSSDVDNLKINMNRTMNGVTETKLIMGHFEKTMNSMSDKIDIILKSTMDRELIIERNKVDKK